MGVLKLGKMVAGMVRFFGSITGQKKLTLANVSIWPQLWTSGYCANKNIESVDGALTLAVCVCIFQIDITCVQINESLMKP